MSAMLIQSCLTLCDPVDYIAHQAPLSMEFSRQEYWSGWPCPLPGDLPDPGIELESLTSPALAGGFFTMSSTREAHRHGRSAPSCLLGLRWGQSQIIEHQKSESITDKQVIIFITSIIIFCVAPLPNTNFYLARSREKSEI